MSQSAGARAPGGVESPPEPAGGKRWLILAVGLIAMTAGCTFQYGIGYLIPALRHSGFSLELASILVASQTAGLLLTLIGWGAAADRWGERAVLAAGLGLAGLVLLAASTVRGAAGHGVSLAFAGAAGGSVFAASGHPAGTGTGDRLPAFPVVAALLVPVSAEGSADRRRSEGWRHDAPVTGVDRPPAARGS
jgi:MFS family permease